MASKQAKGEMVGVRYLFDMAPKDDWMWWNCERLDPVDSATPVVVKIKPGFSKGEASCYLRRLADSFANQAAKSVEADSTVWCRDIIVRLTAPRG